MPLLYRGLRSVLKLALGLYYVDIEATGRDRVPAKGPVIFAANHPNSIMDSVVLGAQTNRSISFLARSGLFSNPLVALLFRRCGVIPVYRRQDGATPGGNDDSFRAAYEVLENGGTLGIFPEGRNAPERHVRDIKTGTARIALGAEAKNGFELGVQVVPVGLNFEDRDAFLSRVLVRVGEPIDARTFREEWEADEREAVRALTERIQGAIRAEAVHIRDERNTDLVHDVNAIWGGALLDEVRGDRPASLDDVFTVKQGIADALEHFERERPQTVDQVRRRVRRYKEHLSQVSLRKDFLDRPPKTLSVRREAVKLTAYAVLLAPIALWGLLHNFVPHRIVRRFTLRAPDEAMRAITGLLVGGLVYGFVYALFGCGIWAASGSPWWALAHAVSLPPAGIFFLRWRRQLARYNDRIVVRTVFRADRKLIRQLAVEREQLLLELDQLRREWQRNDGDREREAGGADEGGGDRRPSAP